MHPSFVYEIAFQLAAFAVLLWLRNRIDRPGELFVIYVAAYALFRFFVEFVRANETVWLDLTRPQWFLLPSLAILGVRLWHGYRHGYYRPSSAIRKCAYDHAPPGQSPRRSPPEGQWQPGPPPPRATPTTLASRRVTRTIRVPRRRATRTGRRNRARGSPSAWCSPDRRRTSRSTWSWPSRPLAAASSDTKGRQHGARRGRSDAGADRVRRRSGPTGVTQPLCEGLGLGLMIGWALTSLVTVGFCTGINPTMYASS